MQNSHVTTQPEVITLPATTALFRTILSNLLFEYAQTHEMTYASIADIFHKVAGVSVDTAGRILNRVPDIRPDTLEKVIPGIGKLTAEPFLTRILCQMIKNEIKHVVFPRPQEDLTDHQMRILDWFVENSSDSPRVMENHKTYTMKYGSRICTKKRIDA